MRSKRPLVCRCYAVEVNIMVPNFWNVVFQKDDMNLGFLSLMIALSIPQSLQTRITITTFTQSSAVYVILPLNNNVCLLNLFAMVSKESYLFGPFFGNVTIKFVVIVWKKIAGLIIGYNYPYGRFFFTWFNWHFEQCSMYARKRLLNCRILILWLILS